MTHKPVFELDDEYDHVHASDGVSRYGAYLTRYARLFTEEGEPTTDAGRFAAVAWRVARPPIMSPGYIRAHGRVQDTRIRWDEDQRQAVCVDLAVASVRETAEPGYPWQHWVLGDNDRWHEPDDYDRPHVLPIARIAVPLSGVPLPSPHYDHGVPDVTTAKHAVRAICATVNAATRSIVISDPVTRSLR